MLPGLRKKLLTRRQDASLECFLAPLGAYLGSSWRQDGLCWRLFGLSRRFFGRSRRAFADNLLPSCAHDAQERLPDPSEHRFCLFWDRSGFSGSCLRPSGARKISCFRCIFSGACAMRRAARKNTKNKARIGTTPLLRNEPQKNQSFQNCQKRMQH